MATIGVSTRILCTAAVAVFGLSACDKLSTLGSDDGAEWARSALERNESLSVVAYDKQAKTFTVKMKGSGELRVVRVDEIVGAVPGEQVAAGAADATKVAMAGAASESTSTGAPENAAAQGSATRVQTGRPAGPGGLSDAAQPAQGSSEAGHAEATDASTLGTALITDPKTGSVLATQSTLEDTARSDASGKRLIASGPGYSIKAGDPSAVPAAAIRLASRSSAIPSPARGVAVEHRYEPMICQGGRLLHIDGRNLEFEGDAISAEDGCEIHITNSHIIAHGVGVSARAANVHIQNSVIEGDDGSVSASQGAKVYTQSSTFKGLSRRLDTATFTDLGGTVWR